jgi:hypothetical protein
MSRRTRRFKPQKDFVVFSPTSEHITLAHERACRLGVVLGGPSATSNRMAGCLGEVAVNEYLPRSKYVGDKIFTHDLVYRRHRVEVKSKVCSSSPAPHFNAFVNGDPHKTPEADVFFFTRVRRDYQKVYLVGWLPAPTFFDEATFVTAGERSSNEYVYRMSGLKLPISELNPPKEFKSIRAC